MKYSTPLVHVEVGFCKRSIFIGTVRCIACGKVDVKVRRDLTMVPHDDCRGGNTAAHNGQVTERR